MPMPLWWGQINKRVFNPRSARNGKWQVIRHVGRVSGQTYRTPLEAHRVDDGFIIMLVYGSRCDWVQNVLAAGPYLPEGDPIFDADDITDRSERFLAAEFLREKLFRQLGEELPYGIAVEIEKFEAEPGLRRIHAAIIVDRDAHKAMVIGKGGERLKRIASEARVELETLFESKVFLEVWVKVKSGWADDERALKSLGYE